jgi:hypothetical protein
MSVTVIDSDMLDGAFELLAEVFAAKHQRRLVAIFRGRQENEMRIHVHKVARSSSKASLHTNLVINGVCLIVIDHVMDDCTVRNTFDLGRAFEVANNFVAGVGLEERRGLVVPLPAWLVWR